MYLKRKGKFRVNFEDKIELSIEKIQYIFPYYLIF